MFTLNTTYGNDKDSINNECIRLYKKFSAGFNMSTDDLMETLISVYDYDVSLGESEKIDEFYKRFDFVELIVINDKQQARIYRDRLTDVLFRQSLRQDEFSGVMLHEKWETVIMRKVVVNQYDVIKGALC